MSRRRVPPERSAELVGAFRRRAHLVEQVDGFIDLEVWQSDRDAGKLIMVSYWSDRAAFKAYMKSDAHRVSHSRIDPARERPTLIALAVTLPGAVPALRRAVAALGSALRICPS